MGRAVKDSHLNAYQNALDYPLLCRDNMVEFLNVPDNGKDSCWAIRNIVYHINILSQKKMIAVARRV